MKEQVIRDREDDYQKDRVEERFLRKYKRMSKRDREDDYWKDREEDGEEERYIRKDETTSDKRQRRWIIGNKEKDREEERYIGKMKEWVIRDRDDYFPTLLVLLCPPH